MRNLLLFTMSLAGLVMACSYGAPTLLHPRKWIILAFLFAISFVVQRVFQRIQATHAQQNVSLFLGIIVVRLVTSIGFIGYFIFTRTEQLNLFIGNFFVLYLCFTGFEIHWLLANLRRNSIS